MPGLWVWSLVRAPARINQWLHKLSGTTHRCFSLSVSFLPSSLYSQFFKKYYHLILWGRFYCCSYRRQNWNHTTCIILEFFFYLVVANIYCHEKIFTYTFFLDFIYLFLERGERRKKEGEWNINMWLPLMCPLLGDQARNPGMCSDWELNQWPSGSQAGTQYTEPH